MRLSFDRHCVQGIGSQWVNIHIMFIVAIHVSVRGEDCGGHFVEVCSLFGRSFSYIIVYNGKCGIPPCHTGLMNPKVAHQKESVSPGNAIK